MKAGDIYVYKGEKVDFFYETLIITSVDPIWVRFDGGAHPAFYESIEEFEERVLCNYKLCESHVIKSILEYYER